MVCACVREAKMFHFPLCVLCLCRGGGCWVGVVGGEDEYVLQEGRVVDVFR